MVLDGRARGRPYFVADIPYNHDSQVQFMNEFYKVTAKFHYREVVAVARAFNMHPVSVLRWKYKETFPRWAIAIDVIEWAKRGKPMTKVYQQKRQGMF